MGGGGKGSAPSVKPTYIDPITGMQYRSAAEMNAAIMARKATEDAKSAADKAAADAKALADRATFNTNLDSAYNQSRTNAEEYFRSLGLDPTAYGEQITNALNTARGKVPDLSPNPLSAFGDNIGQSIVNQIQSGRQNQARTSLDRLFGSNYSVNELPLNLVDPIVSQILANQFDPLFAQLTNAQKRGTLTDLGYGGAQAQLAKDQTAGQSAVSRLGTNVIYTDRGDVDTYINNARNSASSLPLASADLFNPNDYYNEAETRTDRYRQNLYGDTLNALGDTKFSDLQKLLNAGGVVQGATDPTATNPNGAVGPGGTAIGGGDLSPGYIANLALRNSSRGLGSQGAF